MEEVEGVAVDLVLRRGGESEQETVEPVEDGLVFPIDRTVCLIDDDEVEVAGAEDRIVSFVDEAHHRWVRRDEDSA